MRYLILAYLLTLAGCASHRSEGSITASYSGITVASTWKMEVIR